ncbi:hypothetical protein TPHA_0H00240 [Tetrapisispora phaffii CBS 4417]|uniref:Alpha-1,3-mannosyltransferase n=1 Tax=Tetrapisispora phaffii (strain ATCC 24235 / CBS 4417 / NBRC 1672 / NRRL Y-8282 / UCD 70-5) TaxID=1071381 RepID=G8BWT1_TETPH|nr:hypothetical protein TPHA_0H00240 [Tetrapisispora phaffii CBS 4417]CCE64235.1 hypothetical protein TPHA_0H00240 [Tetrapisispora phaffii CBS 4417]
MRVSIIRILKSRKGIRTSFKLLGLLVVLLIIVGISHHDKSSAELLKNIDFFTFTIGNNLFEAGHFKYFANNKDWNPHYEDYFPELRQSIAEKQFLSSSENINEFNEDPISPFDSIPDYDNYIHDQAEKSSSFRSLFSGSYFRDLDAFTKCQFYFNNLYQTKPDWNNDVHEHGLVLNTIRVDKQGQKKEVKVDEKTKMTMRKKDLNLVNERLRIYDFCFIKNKFDITKMFGSIEHNPVVSILESQLGRKSDRNKINPLEFQQRMFPYLQKFESAKDFNKIMPRYSRGDGVWYEKGSFPTAFTSFSTYSDYESNPSETAFVDFTYDVKKSIWTNWNSISDLIPSWKRGIIISMSDHQLVTALKWLAAARHAKVTLPIFFMFKNDDVSKETMHKLHRVARSYDVDIPNSKNYPKLDIWFIDLKPSIETSKVNEFTKYKNKWLALLLNPLKEVLFLDTDTVNYMDPNFYFETEQFKNTGTLFFRDRFLNIGKSEVCSQISETLSPNFQESFYFGKLPLFDNNYILKNLTETDLTTEELVFKSYFDNNIQHELESGLMALDKENHIIPLLISRNLNLYKPFAGCSHGDKEFFWLGFVASGAPFSIYPVRAGTVGEVLTETDTRERVQKRICNLQLVHFAEDKSILWMNGGANNCKFPGFAAADWQNPKLKGYISKFESFESFRDYYEYLPIKTDYGIIADGTMRSSWDKKFNHCKNINWCAVYVKTSNKLNFEEDEVHGELFRLDPEVKRTVDDLNFVWATFNVTQVITDQDIKSIKKAARELSGLDKALKEEAEKKAKEEAEKKAKEEAEKKAEKEAEKKAKAAAEKKAEEEN